MRRLFFTFSFLFGLGAFLSSCGPTTETIIIDRAADAIQAPEGREAPGRDATRHIRILRMGELDPITSLDPLFARNNGTLRAISFLYDRLVDLDANDAVVPAIAHRWEVSPDSLKYTFFLRSDARFQDSSIFTNGAGRRITARDVVFVFERMASRDVPPFASGLFFDSISGFDMYAREQREIFLPSERKLGGISGIRAVNDTTLVISLAEKDRQLLRKLASPYAAVYPKEAVRNGSDRLHNAPVGSGKYQYRRSFGDSVFVFIRNENHYSWTSANLATAPERIEILKNTNETNLFRQLALGRLDLIAEAGPQMLKSMIGRDEILASSYEAQYTFLKHENGIRFGVYGNTENRNGFTAHTLLGMIQQLDSARLSDVAGMEIAVFKPTMRGTSPEADVPILLGHSASNMAQHTAIAIAKEIPNAQTSPFRVQSRAFHYVLLPSDMHHRQNRFNGVYHLPELIMLQVPRYLIHKNELGSVQINSQLWWLGIGEVTGAEIKI